MELKKNKEADIDRLRLPIVFIGFLFVGSLVLASFSYTVAVKDDSKGKGDQKVAAVKFVQESQKNETPPPPPPPSVDAPPPVQEEIKVEKNKEVEPTPVITTPPPFDMGPKTQDIVVKEEIIEFPDVEAAFPGGAAELQKWIGSNVQYPQTSIEMNEQGRVYVSFVVEPDGTITNINIERGVSNDLDKEAKRLLRSMPKWVAGEAGGRKARTRCRLPINFQLN
jgi:protein TonB